MMGLFSPNSGTQEDRDKISCIILGKLFLTNHRGVGRADELESLGISHVICVNEQANDFPGRFIYYNISTLEDQEDHDASRYFEEVISFTNQALAQGGAVCFHCAAGISRSSTMVIAYLMTAMQMCLINAFSLVYHSRGVVWPNRAFVKQLIDYEAALQSEGLLQCAGPSISIDQWDAWTESNEDQVSLCLSPSRFQGKAQGRDAVC